MPPTDHPTFDSWRRASQAYQATVIRRQVETLRRLKYRPVGGFAQLQLADAQPSVGWSVLDHERKPKAGHQALIDACRPVIVVADELPGEVPAGTAMALDVHVVSDRREPIEGAEVGASCAGTVASSGGASAGTSTPTPSSGSARWRSRCPTPPGRCASRSPRPADVEATNTYETRIVRS